MKRFAIVLGLSAMLGMVCAAEAAVITYAASLSGTNENPANASPGNGLATVILDTSAHTLRVVVTFANLSGPTTASHIHCCIAPPQNAGVATTTPTFPGFPLGVTSGSYDRVLDLTQASSWNPAFITAQGGTPAGAEAALTAGLAAGQAYLNVHSSVFPSGEIRGFLTLSPGPAVFSGSAIPTLSQWAMIGLVLAVGVAAVVVVRRRAG
jgi:hypothetical protein